MRLKLDEFNNQNAELLGVDPHEVWSARYLLKDAGLSTDDLNFPMLMDPSQTVSAMYGVAFQMRIHVERSNRPATFIIDKQGVIRFAHPGQNFGDRPTPDQIVAQLKKLK